jgi:3-phenylpropionate/cinnamic acid dioxygenase small subunit
MSREIENLIARYAYLVDDGDFEALAVLFADADFRLNDGPAVRGAAVASLARSALRVYDDGTPRTRHVTTNLLIETDGEVATGRAYFTVFQALPDFPLQPIAAGRYRDRFVRRDGVWRFAARDVSTDLVGDVSRHRVTLVTKFDGQDQ